jgi:leucyl/phenylalanyl-tRNA--protein transferase
MPIYRIPEDLLFPHPDLAEPGGLLGVGGDLQPDRLLLAYQNGIFPWYTEGQPILWFSPDPRFVLYPRQLHIGRTLRRLLARSPFELSMDTDFSAVIAACKQVPRPGQDGTWITEDMKAAYEHLHQLGHAHSVEVRLDGALVGGLYGVAVGRLFAGESMFSLEDGASKVALVALITQLQHWGFGLIDSQVHTETLASMGAQEISRSEYLDALPALVGAPSRIGRWTLDPDWAATSLP